MDTKLFRKIITFGLVVWLFSIGCAHRQPPPPPLIDDDNDGVIYLDQTIQQAKTERQETLDSVDDEIIYTEKEQPPQTEKRTSTASSTAQMELGKASYYGDKFQGRPTASGELYDRNKLTAAHRTLPFGTMCRVTNNLNGKSVNVRINDRGPHIKNRIIDLSYKAMEILDGIQAGTIDVKVEVLP